MEFSLPVLLFLYPITIVLIVLCLIGRSFQYRRSVFICTLSLTMLAAFLGIMTSLPAFLQEALPFTSRLSDFYQLLPFADLGMGWIVPAVIGFVLGLCLKPAQKDRVGLI